MPDDGIERNPVEVLSEEFLERIRRGEDVTPEEYAGKHPELADEILALFPALVMMEDLGGDSVSGPFRRSPAAVRSAGYRTGRLGEFRLLREVGRGGMGVVYEAEQESLGRRVALKVLPAGAITDSKQLRRFEREARSAARLHHTNIVPVFGVGEHEGTHYYVMQFIQGQGLDAVLDELRRLRDARTAPAGQPPTGMRTNGLRPCGRYCACRWPRAGSRRSGLAMAGQSFGTATQPWPVPPLRSAALAVARPRRANLHSPASRPSPSPTASSPRAWRGSACRWPRPWPMRTARASCIATSSRRTCCWTVTATCGWPTSGWPRRPARTTLTHTGDIVGTVRYMAPERFRGEGDARADIYALGLTLYELLALRPAFDEQDRAS